MRKICGSVILLVGVASLVLSFYIKAKIDIAKTNIEETQEKIHQSQGLFSLNPTAKMLEKKVGGALQGKIDADIAYYMSLARYLQISGIILLGIGTLMLIKKKKR